MWNDFDAIPYLAQIVGYKHAGVPIRFSQKDHARDLYMQQSINELPAALNIVTPHILYQVCFIFYRLKFTRHNFYLIVISCL